MKKKRMRKKIEINDYNEFVWGECACALLFSHLMMSVMKI